MDERAVSDNWAYLGRRGRMDMRPEFTALVLYSEFP